MRKQFSFRSSSETQFNCVLFSAASKCRGALPPIFCRMQTMAVGGVILVSDKQARLKPCLRCGYSLRYAAGIKNCPECGLAVRITLAGHSGLEWTNPRWQRFL